MDKLPKDPGTLLLHDSGVVAVLWSTGSWLVFDGMAVIERTRKEFKLEGLEGWEIAERKNSGSPVCFLWRDPFRVVPS